MDREQFLSRFCEEYDAVDDAYYRNQYILEILEDKGFDLYDIFDVDELEKAIRIFIADQLFASVASLLFTSDSVDIQTILADDKDDGMLENMVSIQSWNTICIDIDNVKGVAESILENNEVEFEECEYDHYYISYFCTQELGGLFCEVK